MRSFFFIAWIFATGLAGTPSLAADRIGAALDWHKTEAAGECLDAPALAAAVEARLHRKVFVPSSQADIHIRVSLSSTDASNWLASIDLSNARGRSLGHRELTIRDEHCSILDESLALMVSLMVDITRESLQQKPNESAPFQPNVDSESRPSQPASLGARAAANPSLALGYPRRMRLYVLGSLGDGQLPGLGRGVTLRAEWAAIGWSALMSGTLWSPAQASEAGLGARFWLATAEANACGSLNTTTSRDLALCVGYQAGLLRSRAFGFDVNQSKTTLIHDLTFRLQATLWATAFFGLHGSLGAGLPLAQDEYFGTRTDGSMLRLLSRRGLVPLADFGMAFRLGP